MLESIFRKKRTHLDDEIHAVVTVMQQEGPTSEKYPVLMEYLEQLHKLKANEGRQRVSMDTIVICAVSLAEIVVIVAAERTSVITSKGFVRTIRATLPGMR